MSCEGERMGDEFEVRLMGPRTGWTYSLQLKLMRIAHLFQNAYPDRTPGAEHGVVYSLNAQRIRWHVNAYRTPTGIVVARVISRSPLVHEQGEDGGTIEDERVTA